MDEAIKQHEAEIRALMLANINSDIDQQLDAARTIILLQRELIAELSATDGEEKRAA